MRFGETADTVLRNLASEEWNGNDHYGDNEDYSAAIKSTVVPDLRGLQEAFMTATGGISLLLGYANDDMYRGSDLFDEVFWHLDNHRQPTPAYVAFSSAHSSATTKIWITGG